MAAAAGAPPPAGGPATPAPAAAGPGPALDPDDPLAEIKALAVERKRMTVRMEELKNEKIRRQLEDLESDQKTAEAKAAQQASARAAAEAGGGAGPAGPADTPDTPAAKRRGAPSVPLARTRKRHWLVVASFVIMVLAPVAVSGWYLWTRAHDRFMSYAGFSVRSEEVGSAIELLGGVTQLSGSSSSDTDILYKFIQSPEMVALVDAELDLRGTWGRPGHDWSDPGDDPIFSYNPGGMLAGLIGTAPEQTARAVQGPIEELTDYWNRMVHVYSDSGTGLIDLEVQAFSAAEAQAIAAMVYRESSAMINRLSAIAREDRTRYAREELDQAVDRLKVAREALTRFRNDTQIVDPSASIQGQMGLLNSLQAQLAETLIELDVQRPTATGPNDPRIAPLERKVTVIEDRITAERQKLGLGSATAAAGDERAFADLVGEYERLAVDREFAEQSYTAALAAYDTALAEAQRQSRYLAAHVSPTLPQSSTQPQRGELLGLVALFSFLIWATLVLAVYALRDRR